MKFPLFRLAVLAFALTALTGCANHAQISKDMLTLSPESMKMRQIQTKRFDTNDEKMVITASASVLQDLGFQIDESEPDLGVVVGSKMRDATDAGQVTMAIFIAAMGGGAVPIDSQQTIRVSLVTAPIARPKGAVDPAAPQIVLTPELIMATLARINTKVQQNMKADLAGVLPEKDAAQVSRVITAEMVKELNEDLLQRMKNRDYGATRVRVTFQRVVINTHGQVTNMEALETPELYKEFYEKLSKSVFLEASDI